jgi:hypothetical protein
MAAKLIMPLTLPAVYERKREMAGRPFIYHYSVVPQRGYAIAMVLLQHLSIAFTWQKFVSSSLEVSSSSETSSSSDILSLSASSDEVIKKSQRENYSL